MESEWMGRYRPLVAALVRHSNVTASASRVKMDIGEGYFLTTYEWQVFEAIIENRHETVSMITLSSRIGMPQSTFSKITKYLCDIGLAEKYQAVNNRKNIILKPTNQAIELYKNMSSRMINKGFSNFFEALKGFSDSQIEEFTRALEAFNDSLDTNPDISEVKLVKKE